ncbi:MAG: hypothetical protein NDJ92_08665 [Thermoanaerobaculia bacterium]|nr:hypothetical protein [Thermoanaerobaculia bacterium]
MTMMAILAFTLLSVPAMAQPDLANAAAPIPSIDRMGTAMKGYDTVAYFDYNEATPGDSEMYYDYEKKARFRFASKVNMKRFMSDPDRFLPAYGGYCAFSLGAAPGQVSGLKPGLHEAVPSVYAIVDGRLYLFSSEEARERWKKDENGCQARAEENWKAILEFRNR